MDSRLNRSNLVDGLLYAPLGLLVVFRLFPTGWLDVFLVFLFYLWLDPEPDLTLWARFASLTSLLKACLPFGLIFFVNAFCRLSRPSSSSKDATAWTGPGTPYLIPCRTTHRRLFPEKHAFSYSYLVVGVPVGYRGNINGIVSAGMETGSHWRHKAWFDVDSADYLQRGHGELGLRGKLDDYLRSQDVDPSGYPYAYLITAARFLGYHFNPVSFWYLYSPDKELAAIVLEVNNTFGEKRPYLVLRDFTADQRQTVPSVRGSWPKDFHVSPFSSRKGTYTVLANDPLGPGMQGFRGLYVTICLRSSKEHAKIVARLFSDGECVDPSLMSSLQRLRFVVAWSWIGFVTFPRIAREAAALYFRRRLHVWYRPEPLKGSLGRLANGVEADLERVFRRYLQSVVCKSSAGAFSVRYVPSGIVDLDEQVYTSPATKDQAAEHVEIRVLTPVFYSRFVQYTHHVEAILCEMTECGTVWVDKPGALSMIFSPDKASLPLPRTSWTDSISFNLIRKLRRRPEAIAQPPTTSAHVTPRTNRPANRVQSSRMSPMDVFVLQQSDVELKASYRSAMLRHLMNFHELINLTLLLTRPGLAWLTARLLRASMSKMR
ncbi:hypothetical protein XA68_12422 [Ophiocordyceps unilateralis]|uniref:DUF1365 domain-containing protein n=1 Tax=Ophiocordyceps unilateralis TaxID=268505 RepID=A0A2A9PEV8_OPHUN|nr:hypothetical protein XA68_12422 [Ophiocordyceps unilateralis]